MTDSPFDDVLNPPKNNKGGTDIPFSEEELFGTTEHEEDNQEKQYEFSENYINPDTPWESFTKKQRLKILLLSALPILLQPLATTMAVPTLQITADDLETKYAYVLLTVAGFNILAGIFPMFYGPISDIFGRKVLWYITLPAFAIFAACSGFSVNVVMLIIFRSLLGAVACSPIIIGAGIVTDVFPPEIQGKALGAQQIPALFAPLIGYPLGGLLANNFNWPSVNFFLAVISLPITILVILFLPETHPKNPNRQLTPVQILKTMNPWNTIKLLFNPLIGFIAIARAVGYAAMMMSILLNTKILSTNFGDSPLEVGLWNIPFSIGTMLGSILGGVGVDIGLKRFGRGGRLISANLSTFAISVGLLGYGWTVEWNQWVGMLFSVLIGFGVCANRPGYLAYAMQEIPSKSAAITGSTMFLSLALSLPLSIFGAPLINIIGVPALFTIAATITMAATIPSIFIMILNMESR